MKPCCSIRTRIMAWTGLVTGLILIAVIAWSYTRSRDRLKLEMEDRARFFVDAAAKQIDAQLGVLQGMVHGMALALEAQNLEMPFNEARAMQDRCLRENPKVYGVCIAFEPGFHPAGWPDHAAWAFRMGEELRYMDLSEPDFAHTREDWYALPKYLDRPYWTEPYEWEGVLMVTYSVPLYRGDGDDRSFAGVVTCDLSLDWLDAMIAELPLGQDGYGLLMSRHGTYVAHPLRELVLNETVYSMAEERGDEALRAIGQRMTSGEPGLLPFVSFVTQDLSWLAFTPLRSGDWIMAALVSQEEMHQAIVRLSRQQVGIGAVGLLLLLLSVGLISRSITRPIRALTSAAEELSAGRLDAVLPVPRGHDESAQLTRSFSEMRDHLLRHIDELRETTAARERMRSELAIGHDIQMGLVPKTFPPFPERTGLDLYAVLEPAREVGGDFYDFFLIGEDRMVLSIGDVSGKGVPAALFMAVTRSFLRSAFQTEADPAAVLTRVNKDLVEGNESCMFVTLFCAVLDLRTGEFRYANAGHNAPVLCGPAGTIEWIDAPRGTIAGVVPEAEFTEGRLVLPVGTLLVLYTDGVTEAMTADGSLYGEERLARCLARQDSADCEARIAALLADIRAFTGGIAPSDDITVLMLTRDAEEGAAATEIEGNRYSVTLANTTEEMQRAQEEIASFLTEQSVPPRMIQSARLALDEWLSNIIMHAYDDDKDHRIAVDVAVGASLILTLTDDGKPFNPLKDAPPPVLEGAIEDRPIGGLGLHLIREMGMKLSYRREGNRNSLQVRIPPDPT